MGRLIYVAVAAIGMGIGVAGVPLAPIACLVASAIIVAAAYVIENRGPLTARISFLFGSAATAVAAYAQHFDSEIVLTALAALAVGTAAATAIEQPKVLPAVALAGVAAGALIFLFG